MTCGFEATDKRPVEHSLTYLYLSEKLTAA
jgi:hypothetical protein